VQAARRAADATDTFDLRKRILDILKEEGVVMDEVIIG